MASVSEYLLFRLARRLYHTELAHSARMKAALSGPEQFAAYRAGEVGRVVKAASRYGVELAGKDLLDLGCGDGALTVRYPDYGVRRAVGVDIDAAAIAAARAKSPPPGVEFLATDGGIPLADAGTDVIVSYDVFEHVARPELLLRECHRVLRPGGRMLVGTWGWYHPFAPHLWAVMPVPWAHVVFSERALLRVCRRVYQSPWYVPTMFDRDEHGGRLPDRYAEDAISPDYLNKYLIRDFEAAFRASGLRFRTHLEPFGSRYARWSKMFLSTPWVREFVASYLWAVLWKT